MGKVDDFLKAVLKERKKITHASNGKEFEETIKANLKKYGISEMPKATADDRVLDYLNEIKPLIQAKLGDTLIKNGLSEEDGYTDFFIWQPYGSQDYPDFLVFTKKVIFSIESKYTTEGSKKPVWNGNLPKKDGIYIFGSYKQNDITIFRGNDILKEEERKQIISVWDDMDKSFHNWETEYKEELSKGLMKGEYGFSPYVRRAYNQSKCYNPDAIIDFFTNPHRKEVENKLLKFVEDSDK